MARIIMIIMTLMMMINVLGTGNFKEEKDDFSVKNFNEQTKEEETSKLQECNEIIQKNEISVVNVESIDDEMIKEFGMTEYNSENEAMEDISVNDEIILGEIGLALYPEYDNPKRELKEIREKCSKILKLLEKKYNLGKLSDNNWNLYYQYMYEYLDSEDKAEWYNESGKEFMELACFFDIYENNDINDSLIALVASAADIDELLDN